MALKIQFLNVNALCQLRKNQSYPCQTATHFSTGFRTQIQCTGNRSSDADLASDLATEVAKINTHLAQREEAMKKSKELLFTELCHHLGMEKEEVRRKWSKMEQEEKWGLVKEFVNEWDENFHPLSIKSIIEMIEEFLNDEKSSSNSSSVLFPGLNRIIGFPQNK